jgi:hypothetical protein
MVTYLERNCLPLLGLRYCMHGLGVWMQADSLCAAREATAGRVDDLLPRRFETLCVSIGDNLLRCVASQ